MQHECSCVINSRMSVICQLLLVISINLMLRTRVKNWKDLAKCDFKQLPWWPEIIKQPLWSLLVPSELILREVQHMAVFALT